MILQISPPRQPPLSYTPLREGVLLQLCVPQAHIGPHPLTNPQAHIARQPHTNTTTLLPLGSTPKQRRVSVVMVTTL